jgi:hypothetical protein
MYTGIRSIATISWERMQPIHFPFWRSEMTKTDQCFRSSTPASRKNTSGDLPNRSRRAHISTVRAAFWLALIFSTFTAFAQYSGNLQGTIFDPSKSVLPGAAVELRNKNTGVVGTSTSNDAGLYRFLNIAPGDYVISASANGFQKTNASVTVTTNATIGLDLTMTVTATTSEVTVTGNEVGVNPDETRLQTTLSAANISSLPLQNNSVYGIVQAAPGVTGFVDTRNTDNFTNEHTLDVSANGSYYGGNAYILDGVSIVSNIITGEINISPNPDSIQEASLQTNSFSAQYGNSSSVVDELTSKSGTNTFHGTVNYLFTNDALTANTEFIHGYSPFHRHDITASFGGPIVKDRTFIFGSIEKKLSSSQGLTTGNGSSGSVGLVKYEDPAFTAWAQANHPGTHGTYILNTYKPTSVQNRGIVEWADPAYTTFCTSPVAGCDSPFLDQGTPTTTPYSNGLQYNIRADQYFRQGKDRLFGNYYRTTTSYQAADIRPQFTVVDGTLNWFLSTNYTHVFSPNFTNILTFGAFQAGGFQSSNNLPGLTGAPVSKLPYLSTNAEGITFGGNAWGPATFIQHNYDWNDLVTYIRGRHALKVGVDVYHGDDSANFSAPRERPTYTFANMNDFVADKVFQESGVTFDPLTGHFSPNLFGVQNTREGIFVQDDWKPKPNLLLSLGIRWDDFGNPYPYGYPKQYPLIDNIHIASNGSLDTLFGNAVIRGNKNLFNSREVNNWSPRFGFAWSPGSAAGVSIRGGAGLYRTPITLGQSLDSLDLNPPNWIVPTFGVQQSIPAIYSYGTATTSPFGFVYPTIPATGVNESGGLIGYAVAVNGVNPNLSIAKVVVYRLAVEQQLGSRTVFGIDYSGSTGIGLLSGNLDYNRFAGDLADGKLDRLNPNFGQMGFVWNTGHSNYNALIPSIRQSVKGLTWQASYTWSHSLDNGICATRFDYNQNLDCSPDQHYMPYANSSFDIRNRFTVSGDYRVPNPGIRHLSQLLGGWEVSTLSIFQTGLPFQAVNTASYCQAPAGTSWGPANPYPGNCGDYNQDGFNLDYPNIGTARPGGFKKHQYLTGVFEASAFTTPTIGSLGNEGRDIFRNPGLINVDANLIKNFSLPWFHGERSNLQVRGAFYNVLNRVNLLGVDNSVTSATFGRSTDTQQPRLIQLVGRFQF